MTAREVSQGRAWRREMRRRRVEFWRWVRDLETGYTVTHIVTNETDAAGRVMILNRFERV